MIRVTIAVQPRPYDAIIENGLLERVGQQLRSVLGDRRDLIVVTVPPVRRKWGKKLMTSLSAAGFAARFVEMSDGERYKKLATVEQLAEKLSVGCQSSAARPPSTLVELTLCWPRLGLSM